MIQLFLDCCIDLCKSLSDPWPEDLSIKYMYSGANPLPYRNRYLADLYQVTCFLYGKLSVIPHTAQQVQVRKGKIRGKLSTAGRKPYRSPVESPAQEDPLGCFKNRSIHYFQ